jgi:hypothetical protein
MTPRSRFGEDHSVAPETVTAGPKRQKLGSEHPSIAAAHTEDLTIGSLFTLECSVERHVAAAMGRD